MAADSERVRRELADALYHQAHPLWVGIGGSSGIIAFAGLQWSHRPSAWVLGWAALHVAVYVAFTLGTAFERRRPPTERDHPRWERWFTVCSNLSIVMWGAAVVLFFDGASPSATALMVLFLSLIHI